MNLTLPELWDFQGAAIKQVRIALRKGKDEGRQGVVLSSPTGSGKMEIAKAMIGNTWLKGNRGVFVVDRLTLLEQASRRFYEGGIRHGCISGDPDMDYGAHEPIQLAMIQSLASRGWPPTDVVFADECHTRYRYFSSTIRDLNVPFVGLTATAMAPGIGDTFDDVVQVATTNELLRQGYLAQPRVRPCVPIDMAGSKLVNGEFSADEIRKRGRQIIGDIVSTWVEQTNENFGGPVKTMLFSADIAHGEELCREFMAAGIDARQVSARDTKDYRKSTVEAFEKGEFPIIVSVDVLAKGVDFPDVLCLIMARPYRKAFAAFVQMLGRGMRAFPGKEFVLVLDHSLNYLGFYHELMAFFERGVSDLKKTPFRDVTRQEKPSPDFSCKGCGFILPVGAATCPVCGAERKRSPGGSDIEHVPGEIISIDPLSKGKRGWKGSPEELWQACCTHAINFQSRRGRPDMDRTIRMAKAKFQELYGDWPAAHFAFNPAPNGYVPKAIERQLDASYRRWKASQGKGAAA